MSARIKKTPYELWVGKKPNLQHLRIFGSEAYMHVPKQLTTKLDVRARRVLLVGYEGQSSNYRVYDPLSKKVTVSRDVVFNEKIGTIKTAASEEDTEIIFPKDEQEICLLDNEDDNEENEVFLPVVDNEEVERAERAKTIQPRQNLRNRESLRRPARYESNVAALIAPLSFKEAMESEEAFQWIDAINSELKAHRENRTWSLVERKPGMKIIDSKWVFKLMKDEKGNVHRFKARLCARGFMQQQGVDFTETFAPVVRYDSLRTLLAVVASEDLELAQFDVQTAFLHGELEEEIYMAVPEGLGAKELSDSAKKDVVCRLQKSLYGLKQAPRCWNKKFSAFLKEFNFKEIKTDKCIFVGSVKKSVVYLALYVDDGLIAAKT